METKRGRDANRVELFENKRDFKSWRKCFFVADFDMAATVALFLSSHTKRVMLGWKININKSLNREKIVDKDKLKTNNEVENID